MGIKEAENLIKDAEKALKTSILKWSPDYDEAAIFYEKAGNMFQAQKAFDKAISAFIDASKCYSHAKVLHFSAKNLDLAANICIKHLLPNKDPKNVHKGTELLRQSAEIFKENNNWSRAIDQYVKAAKAMKELEDIEGSLGFFREAFSAIDQVDAEHLRVHSDVYLGCISMLIKYKKLSEALEVMKSYSDALLKIKRPDMPYCRNGLSMIIVLLSMNDEVGAEKLFERISTSAFDIWAKSKEAHHANDLLEAFRSRDPEAIKDVTSKQLFGFLDPEITSLLKSLLAGSDGKTLAAAPYDPNQSTSLVDDFDEPVPNTSASKNPETTDDLC